MSRAGLPMLAVLILLVACGARAGEVEAPLRDEDVVRMVVAGRSQDEILREIRDHQVDFDLSVEMLEELRLAGVSPGLIRAMQDRQAEMESAPVEEAGPVLDLEPELARLTVVLVPVEEKDEALVFPAERFPAALAEQQGLGPDPEDRELVDLAVFLACRTAVHVPDQWRTRSPLGRDFVLMPRHRILAFHAGAERLAAGKARRLTRWRADPGELLRLELPAGLTADLEPGETHDLVLGIAGKIGDRWLVIDSAERDDLEVPDGGATVHAALRSRVGPSGFELDVKFSD